jgi:hypothetical protein
MERENRQHGNQEKGSKESRQEKEVVTATGN